MSDALKRITAMANLLVKAMGDIDRAERALSEAKAEKRKLEEEDLPELMRELTLTEIRLEDGSAVKVVDDLNCAITELNRPAAHAWLREHGFGGLIKTALVMEFAADERAEAVEAAEHISEELGRAATLAEQVHPQTLKAFLKERLAAEAAAPEAQRADGATIPLELFSVRPYAKAKITLPRAK